MILGTLELPVVAVTGLSLDDTWSYATHALIEGKPSRQWVADGARSVALSCNLHADHVDPNALLEELRALADTHEGHVLQARDGRIYGYFVIESLRTAQRWTMPDGTVLAQSVQVQLGEVEAPPPAGPAPQAVEGGAAPTTTEAPAEDTSRELEDVPPGEIARV